MATHTGKDGVIKSGSDVLGELRSFTLDIQSDTIEDSSMGDTARTYLAGLTSASMSAEVFWDEADTSQTSFDPGTSVTVSVYPDGIVSGDTYMSFSAIVTSKSINSSFDGMVEASIGVQASGAITTTTV